MGNWILLERRKVEMTIEVRSYIIFIFPRSFQVVVKFESRV